MNIKKLNKKLGKAIEEGDDELIIELIKNPKVDVNYLSRPSGLTALTYVLEENFSTSDKIKFKLFNMLINHPDIDINRFNDVSFTPLMVAASNPNREIIEILLKQPNIDIDIRNYNDGNALLISMNYYHYESLRFKENIITLIENGSIMEAYSFNKFVKIFYRKGDMEMVELLINYYYDLYDEECDFLSVYPELEKIINKKRFYQ